MKTIHTDKAPAAIGPYSQAVEAGPFIFCSGQVGLHPETGEMQDGLESQINQIFENIDAVLTAAGVSRSHVVKATVFVKNIADFPQVNDLYGKFFGEHKPARSTVEVSNLPKGALVEIEVMAMKA